jgi:molybdopterin molybdotransferase
MSITYDKALDTIHKIAQEYSKHCHDSIESVPLLDAVGRVAAQDHTSPISTPPHDTSAMDGYAVSSKMVSNVSVENPIRLLVKGTIGAGDEPLVLANVQENGMVPCVEIMTGARFPESSLGPPFDACVKIEDTIAIGSTALETNHKAQTCIAIGKKISPNANRRFAGGDMRSGVMILRKGDVVCSRHIMAMASVGITKIAVCRRLRVAVWSTGNELGEGSDQGYNYNQIFNSNGPYLCAALRELGADASYQGILNSSQTRRLGPDHHHRCCFQGEVRLYGSSIGRASCADTFSWCCYSSRSPNPICDD